MAEKVLKVKTVSEVAEAISGLTDLQGSLKGVGTAAFEAAGKSKAEWKALEEEWRKAGAEAKGLADDVFGVESALNAMGRAKGAGQLENSLVKAKVQLEELKNKMFDVAVSGGRIDDGVKTSMARMESAVEAGRQKLVAMKKATEDARRELGLMEAPAVKTEKALGGVKSQAEGVAKGMMSASGAVGPFGEILEKIGMSGTGATSKLAAMAFKVASVGAAFKVGYDAGTSFNKFLQDHGNYLEKAIDATVRFASAQRDARKDASGLAVDIELESENLTEHTKALLGDVVARRGLLNEVKKTKDAFADALPGWKSTAERAKELADQIHAVDAKFRSFEKTGADLRKEIEANPAPLAKFVEALKEGNVSLDSLPASVQKAIAILKELQGTSTDAATGVLSLADALEGIGKGDVLASIEAVAQALKLISLSGGDVGAAAFSNAEGLQKLRDAAAQSAEGLQKFRQEVMDQLPAYQATALAGKQYEAGLAEMIAKTNEYEAARRAANEADIAAGIQMADMKARAADMARSIDTIGEAWARATGQAAGFTVEVRRATKAVEETSPQFNAFIESLAGVSDEYERMVPYVGALIAQLEKGQISTEDFGKAIDAMRIAFMQIQGVSGQMFGDIESLFNRLRELVNNFTYDEGQRNRRPKR